MLDLASIVGPLSRWYSENKREMPWRTEASPYHVWLSEIMLQQTRTAAAFGYYQRFLDQLPDIPSLADAPEDQLLKLWEGLGYYNRVRNMKKAAAVVVERYGGELPADYSLLMELPGIGRYTAGAIASIAYGIREPAVDGNVLRVVMRTANCSDDITKEPVKREVEQAIKKVMPEESPGAFNQALMELGEVVCIPNGEPLCEQCPLVGLCEGRRCGRQKMLPVRAEKKPRRVEERTVLFFEHNRKIGIRKRPGKGLLAGMWEFPSIDGRVTGEWLRGWLSEKGVFPEEIVLLGDAKHIFTHVEWHMTGYRIRLPERSGGVPLFGIIWADRKELEEKYSIPSAFRGFRAAFFQASEMEIRK